MYYGQDDEEQGNGLSGFDWCCIIVLTFAGIYFGAGVIKTFF